MTKFSSDYIDLFFISKPMLYKLIIVVTITVPST